MKKTKIKKQVRRRRGQNKKSLVMVAVFLLVAVVTVAGALGGLASPRPSSDLDLSSWLNSLAASDSSSSGTSTTSPANDLSSWLSAPATSETSPASPSNDLSSWLNTPATSVITPGTSPTPSGVASLIAILTKSDVLTTVDLGIVAERGETTFGDIINVDGVPVSADAQGNFSIRVRGTSVIVLRGKATTGVVVRVNGNPAKLDTDGYFSMRSALNEGSNTIEVTVTDAGGNVTTLRLMVSFTP